MASGGDKVNFRDNDGNVIPECGATDELMPKAYCMVRGEHRDGTHHHYFKGGGGFSWQMDGSAYEMEFTGGTIIPMTKREGINIDYVPKGDTRIPLRYFDHPEDGSLCYVLTCGGTRYDSCEYSFVVARGHVVQGIEGSTPPTTYRRLPELSAEELGEVFMDQDAWADFTPYVDVGQTDISLDGTWNIADLLTLIQAKLAEEG